MAAPYASCARPVHLRAPRMRSAIALLIVLCAGALAQAAEAPGPASLPDVARIASEREKAVVRVETFESYLPGLLRRGLRLLNPFPLSSTVGDAASLAFFVPSIVLTPLRKHLGSGVFIDADGHLLTNHHVVKNTDELTIRFTDAKGVRRKLTAAIVGTDPLTDTALLKVDPGKVPLVTAPLGDSDQAALGDWVVAIGNPLRLTGTVSVGVVSGLHRKLRANTIEDYIQTTAPVNPGNSGGPLFNTRGEIIGLIDLGIFPANSIGFAIPSDLIASALPDLKQHGHARRGYIGISVRDITPEVAKEAGFGVETGAYAAQVAASGPAGQAGMERNDIIVAVGGRKIETARDVLMAVLRARPGEPLAITVRRGDKHLELQATPTVRRAPFRIF